MAPRAHSTATHKFHKRRDAIVRAAVEVVNHKGVRGMTLADVAAKIDLVPTAVMYYFRKKEELAAACFHKAIEQYESISSEFHLSVIDAAQPVEDQQQTLRQSVLPLLSGLRRRGRSGEARRVEARAS